jgi:K+-transporting ATPase ATPase C chain
MKTLFQEVREAVVSTVVLAVICCGLYPLIVWGIGQAVFPDKANGSLITDAEGTVRGSALLAQNFTGAQYFHPRPSAAGAHGYDAAGSGGSNLGPTSQKLYDSIKERVAAYRTENHLSPMDRVPADAVTASGSGLDPHISLKNAELQAPRVAAVRNNMNLDEVRKLIKTCTEGPDLGFLGEPGVNVLKLNLALDGLKQP